MYVHAVCRWVVVFVVLFEGMGVVCVTRFRLHRDLFVLEWQECGSGVRCSWHCGVCVFLAKRRCGCCVRDIVSE